MFTFHHVALSVHSIDQSTAFYGALGFQTVFEWQAEDHSLQIVHLKSGPALLELFCFPRPQAAPETSRTLASDLPRIGIKHFGVSVPSLVEARAALREQGIVSDISITKGRTGIDYFFVRDPDGILVEILQDDRAL